MAADGLRKADVPKAKLSLGRIATPTGSGVLAMIESNRPMSSSIACLSTTPSMLHAKHNERVSERDHRLVRFQSDAVPRIGIALDHSDVPPIEDAVIGGWQHRAAIVRFSSSPLTPRLLPCREVEAPNQWQVRMEPSETKPSNALERRSGKDRRKVARLSLDGPLPSTDDRRLTRPVKPSE